MIQALKRIIYNTIIDAKKKMTPGEVEKAVARATGVDRKTVKLAIKNLVGVGELSYTYVYGTSFLEPSFDRPVRISRRIVIKPPHKSYQPQPGEVVVNIETGVAFGNGAHPTTCLALRAMDVVLSNDLCLLGRSHLSGLDVGTGSGILAIALAKLGVEKVVGIDIDPCALSEATHNVSLNGRGCQAMITKTPLERLAGCFSLIVANLAYPTLRSLSPHLSKRMEKGGVLILSGFKEPVAGDLARTCAEEGLRLIGEETDRQWACLVLRKCGNMVWG